ncbi:uncharacterized protein PHALS_14362 [Plasmopara halstedii]|uniref:Uncharacterized protein n=1 Tax=Plasmopara halstedii TaxID=4781 RepID=A0A0P1ARU7_PLAHL|nr:uncharacterized protein PHALS_14362 [Plasmopara halstedii]CEG44096.1 hypothetical protein PHALS_14362 [Plasmopara halstedii]|eukprot:XP_024580465.1 hypothetical protein PHALS_14362 [Plasmopara halstedii]
MCQLIVAIFEICSLFRNTGTAMSLLFPLLKSNHIILDTVTATDLDTELQDHVRGHRIHFE